MRQLLGALAAFVVASSAWAGAASALPDDGLSLQGEASIEMDGEGNRAVAVQNLFYLNNRVHVGVAVDDRRSEGEIEMFFDAKAEAEAGGVNSDIAFWSDFISPS